MSFDLEGYFLQANSMSPNQTSKSTLGCTDCTHPHRHSRPSSVNLYKEESRLETFQHWPVRYIKPEDLAANGFYYLGAEDSVRCAFCGVEINSWEEGDVVREDHEKFSPYCDIIRQVPCGNIPKGEMTASFERAPLSGYDVCGPFNHVISANSGPERGNGDLPGSLIQELEQLGVSKTPGPAQPKFATEVARLRTYENWPQSTPLKPEVLAAAGFYYRGIEDHVVCFYCGGGLKDWEATDDPWIEHARWFSRCPFVLMQKGRDFVSRATNERPALLSAQEVSELLEQHDPLDDVPPLGLENHTPINIAEVTSEGEDTAGSMYEMETCQICFMRERSIVFLPCGHFVCCNLCASAVTNCPVCRKTYEATVRAYLS